MSHAKSSATWPPRFDGSIWTLVAFGIAFVALTIGVNHVQSWILSPDAGQIVTSLAELPGFVLIVALTLLVLRTESVELQSLGVSRWHAKVGLVAVTGVVVVVNGIVVGLALVSGNDITVGLYAQYVRAFEAGPLLLLVGAVNSYLFTGPAEELAFRGYLQNKILSLIDGRATTIRTGVGIITTALAFAVLHLPDLVLDDGSSLGQAAGGLALLALTAILFGTIYELTQNLVLVALLHGIGNFWPLIVDPGAGVWPNYGVILLVYAALVVVYRRTTFTE